MNQIFNKILSLEYNELSLNKYIDYIVTPITPYLICNHCISTEILTGYKEAYYIGVDLKVNCNFLLKYLNFNTINNNDIIQIQHYYFNFFVEIILPYLEKNNIKVIIITSQFQGGYDIILNNITDKVLNSPSIILWIAQNPIYHNHPKYMAFPYGIHHFLIDRYMLFIKNNNIHITKKNDILNLYAGAHEHLPEEHIRKKYPIFGKNSGKGYYEDYNTFLNNILSTNFLISTAGDRDDCYRHYECLGLNTIPISNIGDDYKEIFEDNMIYSDAINMLKMLELNRTNIEYNKPNRDIITIEYWINKINIRLNNCNKIFQKNIPSQKFIEKEYNKYINDIKTHTDNINLIVNSCKVILEGNCFTYPDTLIYCPNLYTKQLNLFWFGKNAINKICEIGFNAGHSSLLMLLGRSDYDIQYTIFDICGHKYVKYCYDYLSSIFKNVHFEFIEGDSTITMPKYIASNINSIGTYDLVHVDGGHSDICITNDMINASKLVKKGGVIIIDDTNFENINNIVNIYLQSRDYIELNVLETYMYPHRIIMKL